MAYQHIICCLELYLPGTVWGGGTYSPKPWWFLLVFFLLIIRVFLCVVSLLVPVNGSCI